MLEPKAVTAWVQDHFDHVTTEDFVAGVVRYNPDLALTISAGDLWQRALAAGQRLPKSSLEVRAGLSSRDAPALEHLVAQLLEQCGFSVSPLNSEPDTGVDMVVHLGCPGNSPEHDPRVPSVVFEQGERMLVQVKHTPAPQIRFMYRTEADLEHRAASVLVPARRLAEQHALAARTGVNLVGERIRFFREMQGLSCEDLAGRVPGLSSVRVGEMEATADDVSNPDLLLLRRVAAALNITVAQLVEPTPMDLSVVPFPTSARCAA